MKHISEKRKENRLIIQGAHSAIKKMPLFSSLAGSIHLLFSFDGNKDGACYVADSAGTSYYSYASIYCNDNNFNLTPLNWQFVIAHCMLHLGFGHFKYRENQKIWNYACCAYVNNFLLQIKVGKPPFTVIEGLPNREEKIYDQFMVSNKYSIQSCNGNSPDMAVGKTFTYKNWADIFTSGILPAVKKVVSPDYEKKEHSIVYQAKKWFLASCPLLGAVAQHFEIVTDRLMLERMQIHVAAIDTCLRELYVNINVIKNVDEMKFVMGHEFLHAALDHQGRNNGRDFFIWNLACDFVINDWLIQMGMGKPPEFGYVFDEQFRGMSADEVYDILIQDVKAAKRLATLAGIDTCDLLNRTRGNIDRTDALKEALLRGFWTHIESGRGLLPAGLVEEIKAIDQPPVSWDVKLARWFEENFPCQEKYRSYARPSRRQSAVPDIPLPKFCKPRNEDAYTFGVLIDTSGSMDRKMLGMALGAVASYSRSRDIEMVRLVFCDAHAHDAGYVDVDEIANRIEVKGRGGTILQPGIDLLENAKDLPEDSPVLIITDTFCESTLAIKRRHAFIVPQYGALPFKPIGPVFRFKE